MRARRKGLWPFLTEQRAGRPWVLTSAKMLLAAYMPPLRIVIRGKNPPDHPLCQASDLLSK